MAKGQFRQNYQFNAFNRVYLMTQQIINNYPAKLRGIWPSASSAKYQAIFRKIEQDNCFIIQQTDR